SLRPCRPEPSPKPVGGPGPDAIPVRTTSSKRRRGYVPVRGVVRSSGDRIAAMARIHLINPSTRSFGVAVITPRWLYGLASATGVRWGDPRIVDETLEPVDLDAIQPGDVVGIGIHTANARRGYEIGREARIRGAWVVFGGIHATLFPDEAVTHGAAHSVVRGDGDVIWPEVIDDCLAGHARPVYEGGRI